MKFPEFIQSFPSIDIPFPEEAVSTSVVRSDAGLVVFFTFHQDVELPEHSHGAQWGHLIQGEIEMVIDGVKKTCRPGDSWDLPAGVPHSAVIKAGTLAVDVFEEPDRYPIRP
jgi:quercetin dioxygenase-like cupin family protein